MYVRAGRTEGLTMRLYKNISENLSKDREFSALNFLNQISAQKIFVKICFQIEKKIQIYLKVGNGGGGAFVWKMAYNWGFYLIVLF